MRLSLACLSLTLFAGPLFGCGSDVSALDSDDPSMQTPTVARDYHQDAKAVLDRYCTTCHMSGGIAPFTLTDYAAAQGHAESIRSAVEGGRMPPWMPSDDSAPLRYSRK